MTGKSLSFRPELSTEWVSGKLTLYRETLSQKLKQWIAVLLCKKEWLYVFQLTQSHDVTIIPKSFIDYVAVDKNGKQNELIDCALVWENSL